MPDELESLREHLRAAVAREAVLHATLQRCQPLLDYQRYIVSDGRTAIHEGLAYEIDEALANPSPATARHMERHAALEALAVRSEVFRVAIEPFMRGTSDQDEAHRALALLVGAECALRALDEAER